MDEKLTAELIAATPDSELHDLIVEFVDAKKPADWTGDDYSWLGALPKGVQLMWALVVVEHEVGDGGINQLFMDGTDVLAETAADAFTAIGAYAYAELISEVMRRAHQSKDGRDPIEGYGDEIFQGLIDRWVTLDEQIDLEALRVAWIRAHTTELVTD
jgi:hypothetical protein